VNLPLIEPAALAAELGPVEHLLIAIDFDGTLAPIVDRPDDAVPAPGAVAAVRRLSERATVVMLSGRTVEDLLARLPDLPVIHAGGHGAQIRDVDGTVLDLIDVATVAQTLDATQASVEPVVDDGIGWFIERKATSLAVHHRLVPEDEVDERLPRVRALMEQRDGDDPGFEVVAGKSVLEMRPRSVSKGRALDRIADRSPQLVPVVLGDDVTDEDAFRSAIARGGHAILVAREDRESVASRRLRDPEAVAALLEHLADARPGA
jgi:trehalose-phosphatase